MFAIAPTDLSWFFLMREGRIGRVVNFWTPTPWSVRGLGEGDRLYFMLKSPIRLVGGYGTFVRYVEMTANDAWNAYGLGNGVESREELVAKVLAFAEKNTKSYVPSENPVIGCIELTDVVALDQDHYIDPASCGHPFPKEVVKLKYFHEEDGIAARLRDQALPNEFQLVVGVSHRKPVSRKERQGQSAFRQAVLRNYSYRCCMFGDEVVELLEAAHIQPYVDERSNHLQNGLCLRVDVHRLFDEGLLAIGDDHTILVSTKLSGTSYAGLAGKRIELPASERSRPSQTALAHHRAGLR